MKNYSLICFLELKTQNIISKTVLGPLLEGNRIHINYFYNRGMKVDSEGALLSYGEIKETISELSIEDKTMLLGISFLKFPMYLSDYLKNMLPAYADALIVKLPSNINSCILPQDLNAVFKSIRHKRLFVPIVLIIPPNTSHKFLANIQFIIDKHNITLLKVENDEYQEILNLVARLSFCPAKPIEIFYDQLKQHNPISLFRNRLTAPANMGFQQILEFIKQNETYKFIARDHDWLTVAGEITPKAQNYLENEQIDNNLFNINARFSHTKSANNCIQIMAPL